MEEIDMLKAGELCVDDVFAAASNVGLLTAADPSRKPNPVKGGTRMGYRVGLTALVVAATLNLIYCDGDDNRPTPDTTPPTVVSIIPANGATNVAVSTTVSVNFSQPLDCTSVTAASFTLTSAGAVAGSISCSGSSVTFTPVTTNNTKTSVDTTGATLSSLTNGTPVFAAVTAVNAGGESALSTGVCAVPTAASTAGLTLYNPLCGGTLDGNKWRTPLFSRSVSGGALVLSSQISNMESRTVQGLFYRTAANVNAGAQRVTTLKPNLTVPAA